MDVNTNTRPISNIVTTITINSNVTNTDMRNIVDSINDTLLKIDELTCVHICLCNINNSNQRLAIINEEDIRSSDVLHYVFSSEETGEIDDVPMRHLCIFVNTNDEGDTSIGFSYTTEYPLIKYENTLIPSMITREFPMLNSLLVMNGVPGNIIHNTIIEREFA